MSGMGISSLIGGNLQRARLANQFSLGDLARRSGLSKQTVAKLETGDTNPTIETLAQLADALKISVRELVTDAPDNTRIVKAVDADWRDAGAADARELDRVRGSGYVISNLLRLRAERGSSRHEGQGRGSLRHVFVIEGQVRVHAGREELEAHAHDFVRFSAEHEHVFTCVSTSALLHIVTTSPDQAMESAL